MSNKFIQKNSVKSVVNDNNLVVSVEYYESLNEKVKQLINESINRAIENKRSTVMSRDL